jgi:hypothetical protein
VTSWKGKAATIRIVVVVPAAAYCPVGCRRRRSSSPGLPKKESKGQGVQWIGIEISSQRVEGGEFGKERYPTVLYCTTYYLPTVIRRNSPHHQVPPRHTSFWGNPRPNAGGLARAFVRASRRLSSRWEVSIACRGLVSHNGSRPETCRTSEEINRHIVTMLGYSTSKLQGGRSIENCLLCLVSAETLDQSHQAVHAVVKDVRSYVPFASQLGSAPSSSALGSSESRDPASGGAPELWAPVHHRPVPYRV